MSKRQLVVLKQKKNNYTYSKKASKVSSDLNTNNVTRRTASPVNSYKYVEPHQYYSYLYKIIIISYQVLHTIFWYFVQILIRLPALALLTSYLGDWFGLYLAALLPVNFTLATMNLKTLTAKNFWNGLLSTLAPIYFVAKDKIKIIIVRYFLNLQK